MCYRGPVKAKTSSWLGIWGMIWALLLTTMISVQSDGHWTISSRRMGKISGSRCAKLIKACPRRSAAVPAGRKYWPSGVNTYATYKYLLSILFKNSYIITTSNWIYIIIYILYCIIYYMGKWPSHLCVFVIFQSKVGSLISFTLVGMLTTRLLKVTVGISFTERLEFLQQRHPI